MGRGDLFILGCVFSWSLYSVIGKTALKDLSPLVAVCYSALAGTLLLLVPAGLHGAFGEALRFSPGVWLAIGYLGIFGTVIGFLWYFQGIGKIGPTRAGVFINFVPVNALLLAALLLGERFTLSLVGGGMCVVVGAYLANTAAAAWSLPPPQAS